MFTFDLLDEMMPIFKATFSEARFFPCPYEGGGVHRVIGCFFKVPRCFKASLAKELAQTACKCALASAGKSFDKNNSHDMNLVSVCADFPSGTSISNSALAPSAD